MIYFQVKNSNGNIIAGNMHDFLRCKEFEKNKNYFNYRNGEGIKSVEENFEDCSIWFVVEGRDDLLKSAKLFLKTLNVYKIAALDVWRYHKTQIDSYSHTITTIQGQIRQKIEGFANDDKFYGDSYSDSIESISEHIKSDIMSAADLICYTHKRINDLRAHLLGVEVVHAGEHYKVNFDKVSLKRALLNQCTPFLCQFEEKSVNLRYFFDEKYEIDVDKNMFSLIMYNFFSNAVKYTKPNSELRFQYKQGCLDISMISLKIEKSEIGEIFNEGVRGKHSLETSGKGVGLFVLKKALELMGKDNMYIDPEYSRGDNEYVENHFKFIF